ncbi:branched-chain amino acid transporter permease [Rhodococcus sp. IEGM 1408]|uniref:branched-chain amino acid transporter permease n=1 Tax=Rhodococcus sp. IEGM 1408 TaxID=3082220 RepID=UPI002953C048|nr:AzlD domain-containing protein [Rhodococcus sp. IEGM 1408]MDV8000076.1 AzlD domain-containing protein [Rhodococcus sp. IEGM 1408]
MSAELPGAGYLLAGLGVMLVVTVALRAAPFVALTRLRDSEVVRYLGRTMPAGVMVVLVIYTLRDTTTALASWVPAAAALALTLAVHLAFRRAAASIVLGTAAYLVLQAWLG